MAGGNNFRERIKGFILEKFPLARKHGLNNSDKLLESGILDSLGILDLVNFVEQEFAIHVSDEELVAENFQTVEHLTAFIQRKSNTNSAQVS